ncbi:hypothetical protein P9D74_04935 [Bacillus vallismortis]|uniref:hypothetical protein n=1 Tax=Bacillus vallismortis TaxID=72361 RepID=UPI002DBC8A4C|nr:hypothetical protein [Bacillus vallismortis]MEC1650327.1 hypothetical protein [Bacillus vallismortis]
MDGKIENKKEGKMAKGLNYEVEDMQAGSKIIDISLDVLNIIVRQQWGITYPFEYENIRSL